MYCKRCGKELNEDALFCPACGTSLNSEAAEATHQNPPYKAKDTSNPLAIVGFILSFFCPIAGLICSILGYNNAKTDGLENKGLALAGIIISAAYIGFVVLCFINWFFILSFGWY